MARPQGISAICKKIAELMDELTYSPNDETDERIRDEVRELVRQIEDMV